MKSSSEKGHSVNLNLIFGFSIVIFLFFFVGMITLQGVMSLGEFTKTIHQHPLVVSNAALRSALNITKMHRSMKDVVLSYTKSEQVSGLSLVSEYEVIVYEQLDLIKKRILGDEGKRLEQETRSLFNDWKPIREEVASLMAIGKTEEAVNITRDKGARHVALLESKMLELTRYARSKANGFLVAANNKQSTLVNTTVFLASIGVITSLIVAVYTGIQVYRSHCALKDKANELRSALEEIKTLRGIIPICSHCKQIRNDDGVWQRVEQYIHEHSDANFSHGVCPDCMKKHYSDYLGRLV